ncbi:hypothetical protein MFKK_00120 [Halopseudomonas aestusnigri]|uniref:hypothetical protein n=1 Tax=Halopseudomonas TaxID=2901189 RepID=UPI0022B6D738|nr:MULTISPECIES: hypothetical protein [Halopseudomonas]BDX17202.1 hypothetical protein MFKK_00120 [Halopseudomonas aestusnigri]
MNYIPKRVLYSEFPDQGVYGITARQALEAAIDNIVPAYHLILCPVTLHEYLRSKLNPLGVDFGKWHGLTVRIPLGVLYTLNFYPQHQFADADGKPSALLVEGPLGVPGMQPEVKICDEYLLWPEAGPITFDKERLFFLREDLEGLSKGTLSNSGNSKANMPAAGQPLIEIEKPSQLLLIAALLELLKQPRTTASNQEAVKTSILEQFNWRGLSKRSLEKMLADANRAADHASKD